MLDIALFIKCALQYCILKNEMIQSICLKNMRIRDRFCSRKKREFICDYILYLRDISTPLHYAQYDWGWWQMVMIEVDD